MVPTVAVTITATVANTATLVIVAAFGISTGIRTTGEPTLSPPRRPDPLGTDGLGDLVILPPPPHSNRTAGDLVHPDRPRVIEPDRRPRTTRRRRRTQSLADPTFERLADLLTTIDRHQPHPILGNMSARRVRSTHGPLPDAGLHEIDEGGERLLGRAVFAIGAGRRRRTIVPSGPHRRRPATQPPVPDRLQFDGIDTGIQRQPIDQRFKHRPEMAGPPSRPGEFDLIDPRFRIGRLDTNPQKPDAGTTFTQPDVQSLDELDRRQLDRLA